MDEGWRTWILASGGSVRVSRGVQAVAAVGLAAAAVVVAANLARGRAVPALADLLFVAIPALVAGQLWCIAVVVARRPASEGRRWYRPATLGDFFAGLRRWERAGITVVFVAAWLLAVEALFFHLTNGGPASSTPGCPYRLVNHGEYSCVSRSTYIAVGAAQQRFVAGVLAGFFVAHLGLVTAELRRRCRASVVAEPAA